MTEGASTAVGASARTASKEELEIAYRAILEGELPEGFGAAEDAEAVSRAIVQRIAEADDFDAVFSPQDLPGWRDVLLDTPVKVIDFHLNRSTVAGGAGSAVYAVVEVERLSDGEHLTVSCGGRNVLAQLVKILEKGWWDKPLKMISKRTREGYDALWLVSAGPKEAPAASK